ncbi:hypothetical protein CPA46_07875 [Sphingopyxis terrae subsp. ummariensis]|nr:hypothetical protein CPA46_07875 [Sphingopyxis terrae subsp. ummariensis]
MRASILSPGLFRYAPHPLRQAPHPLPATSHVRARFWLGPKRSAAEQHFGSNLIYFMSAFDRCG